MGRVYQAHDRELGEEVAIKTLLGPAADEGDAERLLREAQICRKVTHPNIVRVFDFGRYEGGIFLTMELLSGERLDSLVFRNGPLPLPQIREILTQIGAGLAEAHSLGIIHREGAQVPLLTMRSRLASPKASSSSSTRSRMIRVSHCWRFAS